MNVNEITMLGMIAERIKNNGGAVRGIFNLLHDETQMKILRLDPAFLRYKETGEFKKAALETINTMLVESGAL